MGCMPPIFHPIPLLAQEWNGVHAAPSSLSCFMWLFDLVVVRLDGPTLTSDGLLERLDILLGIACERR